MDMIPRDATNSHDYGPVEGSVSRFFVRQGNCSAASAAVCNGPAWMSIFVSLHRTSDHVFALCRAYATALYLCFAEVAVPLVASAVLPMFSGSAWEGCAVTGCRESEC